MAAVVTPHPHGRGRRRALILAISGALFFSLSFTPSAAQATGASANDGAPRLLVIVDQGSLARRDAPSAARTIEGIVSSLQAAGEPEPLRTIVSGNASAPTSSFERSLAGTRGFSDDLAGDLGLSMDEAREVLRGNESVRSELAARPCAPDDRRRRRCGGNIVKQAEAAAEEYQTVAEQSLRTIASTVRETCGSLAPHPLIIVATSGPAYRVPPMKAFRTVKEAVAACKATLAIVRLRPTSATETFAQATGARLHDIAADGRVEPALSLPLSTSNASAALNASRSLSPSGAADARARDDAKLPELVLRASDYVATFAARAAVLLATEEYEQEVRTATNLTTLDAPVGAIEDRRRLESEIALLQLDDGDVWLLARDIVSVDGRALAPHERRPLTAVRAATRQEAMRQFKAIANEGARFNIGSDSVTRNINLPTLALWFLTPGMRARFGYSLKGNDTVDGTACRTVSFKERRKPYLLQVNGRHAPAAGRFCIRPDGTVIQTELRLTNPDRDTDRGGARIQVSYAFSDAVQTWVPHAMEERYLNARGLNAGLIVARARYRDYKQFVVETKVSYPK